MFFSCISWHICFFISEGKSYFLLHFQRQKAIIHFWVPEIKQTLWSHTARLRCHVNIEHCHNYKHKSWGLFCLTQTPPWTCSPQFWLRQLPQLVTNKVQRTYLHCIYGCLVKFTEGLRQCCMKARQCTPTHGLNKKASFTWEVMNSNSCCQCSKRHTHDDLPSAPGKL